MQAVISGGKCQKDRSDVLVSLPVKSPLLLTAVQGLQ